MELALIGALAAAGWALSTPATTSKVKLPQESRFAPLPPPSGASGSIGSEVGAPPPPDDLTIAQIQQELAQGNASRYEAALDPSNQPIAGDRRFMFTSARGQNLRPETLQFKQELFTGALNAKTSETGTWRPKRESKPFFSVNTGFAPVTSDGKGTRGVTYNRREYEKYLTNKQHNVVPTPQVRVGPGIGIPIDQAAGNGFNYGLNRILPRNINEYRLNRDMHQRPAAGGTSVVPVRTSAPAMVKYRPVKFWTLDRRPLAPGRATVTAHDRRPEEPRAGCFGTKRDAEERDYLGIATHALTKEGPVPAHAVRATRPEARCDDPWPLPAINPTMHASTQPRGAYAKNSYDCNRFIRQQREQTVQKEGSGFVGGTTQRGTLPTTSYVLAPTKRALVPSFGCEKKTH